MGANVDQAVKLIRGLSNRIDMPSGPSMSAAERLAMMGALVTSNIKIKGFSSSKSYSGFLGMNTGSLENNLASLSNDPPKQRSGSGAETPPSSTNYYYNTLGGSGAVSVGPTMSRNNASTSSQSRHNPQNALTADPQDEAELAQIAWSHYVESQYRNFAMFEHILHHPKQLSTQPLFFLAAPMKQFMLQSYYSFSPHVIREILGKKLTSRLRKELDDVSQKTRVPLIGCRRMFDNLKRVTKLVEDIEGNMKTIIQSEFALAADLAAQYAQVIFINNYRIDTSKKRLSHLPLADFQYVASVFMTYLTTSPDNALEEMDVSIAQDSRDLKSILFYHKETLEAFRIGISSFLTDTFKAPHILEKAGQYAIKIILKNILSIGAGLTNGKEVRDLFGSIQERIVEPALSFEWSPVDLDRFIDACVILFSNGLVPVASPAASQQIFSENDSSDFNTDLPPATRNVVAEGIPPIATSNKSHNFMSASQSLLSSNIEPSDIPEIGISASVRKRYMKSFARLLNTIKFSASRFMTSSSSGVAAI